MTPGVQMEADVTNVKEELAQTLFDHIPVGVGSQGIISTNAKDLEAALEMGMDWSLREVHNPVLSPSSPAHHAFYPLPLQPDFFAPDYTQQTQDPALLLCPHDGFASHTAQHPTFIHRKRCAQLTYLSSQRIQD